MVNNFDLINQGFAIAQRITKKSASTFYFASCFLARDTRQAAYTIYAICRIVDNSVDEVNNKINTLEEIKEKIDLSYSEHTINDPLIYTFRYVVNKYSIPRIYFDELVSGMYMDLNKNRYRDFNELYIYCYKVAGVVGLIMLKLFDLDNFDIAQGYAINLGVAMQLTNILRDIKADYQLNRIYLPQNEMAKYNLKDDDIAFNRVSQDFKDFMQYNIIRARNYYSDALAGVKLLTNKRIRFVVRAMAIIYSMILGEIEKNQYNVFKKRMVVSKFSKIIAIYKIFFNEHYPDVTSG